MKMLYEAPEMRISMYQAEEVIVASVEESTEFSISINEDDAIGGGEG